MVPGFCFCFLTMGYFFTVEYLSTISFAIGTGFLVTNVIYMHRPGVILNE